MKKVSVLFFGTPLFAAEILSHLIDHEIEIVGIVTQPDRPKGRSLQMSPSPVKEVAQKRAPSIPIFQPQKASEPLFLSELAALQADLYVVVAFGQILPQKLLDIPPLGCINVHASLLPKYRGAAPIHRCLLNGDEETGVSIQKMVKQLDAGDVIAESRIALGPNTTFGELEKSLCELSKPLLVSVIHKYSHGVPPAQPQDPAQVTFAAKVSPEEGEIKWADGIQKIHNLIRAFSPRPGAWVWVDLNGEKKRVKILLTQIVDRDSITPRTPFVRFGEHLLQILEVQPEGKPRMKGADWFRGLKEIPFPFCV